MVSACKCSVVYARVLQWIRRKSWQYQYVRTIYKSLKCFILGHSYTHSYQSNPIRIAPDNLTLMFIKIDYNYFVRKPDWSLRQKPAVNWKLVPEHTAEHPVQFADLIRGTLLPGFQPAIAWTQSKRLSHSATYYKFRNSAEKEVAFLHNSSNDSCCI